MVGFIDDHRHMYGVESICRVVPIALSYFQHKAHAANPSLRSPRGQRDEKLQAIPVRFRPPADVERGISDSSRARALFSSGDAS
jgi:hypothetical protein